MIKTNPFFDFAGGSRRAPNPERPVARSAGCSEKPAQPTKTKNSSRGTRGGQETKTQQTRSGSVARPGNFFPFFPLLFLLIRTFKRSISLVENEQNQNKFRNCFSDLLSMFD